ERETRKPVLLRSEMRQAEAGGNERAESLHVGNDELTGKVGVKLVQRHISHRGTGERSAKSQRRRGLRPPELDEGEVIETNARREPVARRILQRGLNRCGRVRLDRKGPS